MIFLADGTIRLAVQKVKTTGVLCRVVRGGNLFSGKGINIPGKRLGLRALTPKDVSLLQFASAARRRLSRIVFHYHQRRHHQGQENRPEGKSHAWVIAKIETQQAVQNFEDIVKKADGVMVARGDLGVEMEIEDVPSCKKK